MEKEVNTKCSDEMFFDDLSGRMNSLMIKSFEDALNKVNTNLDNINKSERKDKKIIIEKYKQEIVLLNKLKELIKRQNDIQKELIIISEQKSKLDDEINKLLLS